MDMMERSEKWRSSVRESGPLKRENWGRGRSRSRALPRGRRHARSRQDGCRSPRAQAVRALTAFVSSRVPAMSPTPPGDPDPGTFGERPRVSRCFRVRVPPSAGEPPDAVRCFRVAPVARFLTPLSSDSVFRQVHGQEASPEAERQPGRGGHPPGIRPVPEPGAGRGDERQRGRGAPRDGGGARELGDRHGGARAHPRRRA